MISNRRFTRRPRKTFPKPAGPWLLDSGGFTELNMYGEWTQTPEEYAKQVSFYMVEMGNLEWAAPQDWMCEPKVLKKTGLNVQEHQKRTVANFLELRYLAPDAPFIPVLQGWNLEDYNRCVEAYDKVGVDLTEYKAVGVGSVCRRQGSQEIQEVMEGLSVYGLRLHGFGVKINGLKRYAKYLASSDSLAWCQEARWTGGLEECTHKTCTNCLKFALKWRDKVLGVIDD